MSHELQQRKARKMQTRVRVTVESIKGCKYSVEFAGDGLNKSACRRFIESIFNHSFFSVLMLDVYFEIVIRIWNGIKAFCV